MKSIIVMNYLSRKITIPAIVLSALLITVSVSGVDAQTVPEWVKNNALWYGLGLELLAWRNCFTHPDREERMTAFVNKSKK